MPATQPGSVRLFHFAGIDVFVHWSWLLVAIVEVQIRQREYQSFVWNIIEYLALFGIVLLHEFGHSLACRQVGGTANRIMLWPLGGIAYVSPPPRPGAVLWSIAAGPLVNVALVPVLFGLYFLAGAAGWFAQVPDLQQFLGTIVRINIGLLVFNMLPIYPLDGGQIAQALLWFVIGQARSLLLVSSFGLLMGAGLIALALWLHNTWIVVLAGFMALRCWNGFQQARAMLQVLNAPRHYELHCPTCGASPPAGEFWVCGQCGAKFDTFSERGVCPGCGGEFPMSQCSACHARHPMQAWGPPNSAPK
ncbi:MAG TPA: site-2 protease family protein [Pirellulales bacterium]|nr:site-2 protease family protein [Pirellulales bacterium]